MISSDGKTNIDVFYANELSDHISDRDVGAISFEKIDQSLVCQWNPNFLSAIYLDTYFHKADELSTQAEYVVNSAS